MKFLHCSYRLNELSHGKFIFVGPEGQETGRSPERTEAPQSASAEAMQAKAQGMLSGALNKLNKVDQYVQDWSKSLMPLQEDSSKFKEGESAVVDARPQSGVNFRNTKTGAVEKMIPNGEGVRVSSPLNCFIVKGKMFIEVQDRRGNTGCVSITTLIKPSEKRPTQKLVAKATSAPSVPEGWVNDEALGQLRPMTQEELAMQKAEREAMASMPKVPASPPKEVALQKPQTPKQNQSPSEPSSLMSLPPEDLMSMPEVKKVETYTAMQTAPEKAKEVPKTMQEYLAAYPKLLDQYNTFKINLESSLRSAIADAPSGAVTENIKKLSAEFSSNFDGAMLKLFTSVDLVGSPQVIERLLKKGPPKVDVQFAELSRDTAGRADIQKNPPPLLINKAFAGSYSDFKVTFIHEMTHIYLEDLGVYKRNPRMNEGITEALAQEVHASPETTKAYSDETALAKALLLVDKKALADWYTGGSDENFRNNMLRGLNPIVGEKRAFEMVSYVMSIPAKEEGVKEAAVGQMVALVRKRAPASAKVDDAKISVVTREFFARHYDFDQWKREISLAGGGFDFTKTDEDTSSVSAIMDNKKVEENKLSATLSGIASEIQTAYQRRANPAVS